MNYFVRLNPFRWPYSLGQLRIDEPTRSFSPSPSDAELAYYDVFRLVGLPQPEFDPTTHRIQEVQPIEADGEWLRQWEVVELTEAEREAYYRQTHPPQWAQFAKVMMANASLNTALVLLLRQVPASALALSVGLAEAANGDSGVFLDAWAVAKARGIITPELVAATRAAAVAHDLPAAFVEGL